MANSEENTKGMLDLALAGSAVLMLFVVFYFGYGFWTSHGLMPDFFTSFFRYLVQKNGAPLSSDIPLKAVSMFFAFLYIIGTKVRKRPIDIQSASLYTRLISGRLNKYHYLIFTISSLVFFLLSYKFSVSFLPSHLAAGFYIITSVVFYILTFVFAASYKRYLSNLVMADRFNKEGEIFDNEKRLINTDSSVNIPFKNGAWLNIPNVYAGTIITGNPGTGKSYVFFCEYIKQLMLKGFTMIIYDFKTDKNNLTDFAYNVYTQYYDEICRQLYSRGAKAAPEFVTIDFERPEYTKQINVLSPKVLRSLEDIDNAAKIFFLNLNRNYAERQGDFFLESGKLFIACIMALLRYSTLQDKKKRVLRQDNDGKYYYTEVDLVYEGNCSSIPHLITMLQSEPKRLYKILQHKRETQSLFNAFLDAVQNDAGDQLAGQIASGKLPLASLATPNVFWPLSDDGVDIEISNPSTPKFLCLRNNERKYHAYTPPLGLILGQVINALNTPDRLSSGVVVDELSTCPVYDLDHVIASARSKKVAVVLGFQDFSQLNKGYGKTVADVTNNVAGNVLTGAVRGDTAKSYQELFGKVKQRRISTNISRNDTSTNISSQLEYLLPASSIMQLSQGEFCGKVADTTENPLDMKLFRGHLYINSQERLELSKLTTPKVTSFPDIDARAEAAVNLELAQDATRLSGLSKEQLSTIIQNRYIQIKEKLIEEMLWDNKNRIKEECSRLLEQLEHELTNSTVLTQ